MKPVCSKCGYSLSKPKEICKYCGHNQLTLAEEMQATLDEYHGPQSAPQQRSFLEEAHEQILSFITKQAIKDIERAEDQKFLDEIARMSKPIVFPIEY